MLNGNTFEMLPNFIEEPLASAEVWQPPVVVAPDITAGGWWRWGGVRGEVGVPWRASSGKTLSTAATVQL